MMSDRSLCHLLLAQGSDDFVSFKSLLELFTGELADLLQILLEGQHVLFEGFLEGCQAVVVGIFFCCKLNYPTKIKGINLLHGKRVFKKDHGIKIGLV